MNECVSRGILTNQELQLQGELDDTISYNHLLHFKCGVFLIIWEAPQKKQVGLIPLEAPGQPQSRTLEDSAETSFSVVET